MYLSGLNLASMTLFQLSEMKISADRYNLDFPIRITPIKLRPHKESEQRVRALHTVNESTVSRGRELNVSEFNEGGSPKC